VFLFSVLVLVAHLHTSFLRFSFILVYFNNRWGTSSMDAPSIVSRRTSVGNLIKLGCPFQRTKLYHFDVGLFIVESVLPNICPRHVTKGALEGAL